MSEQKPVPSTQNYPPEAEANPTNSGQDTSPTATAT